MQATEALLSDRPEGAARIVGGVITGIGFVVHREYVGHASGDVRRRLRAPEFDALMADPRAKEPTAGTQAVRWFWSRRCGE